VLLDQRLQQQTKIINDLFTKFTDATKSDFDTIKASQEFISSKQWWTLPPIILKDCKNLVPNNTKTISTKCILVVVTCNIIYCTMKTIRCLVDVKSINTTFENYKV
jgi:hypothetical protein